MAVGRSGRGVARSDNLSAATHELPLSGGRTLTKRYQGLLEHYGLKSTRIFPRKAHENGVVEQAHRRTKSMLAQMLVLRGSRDFPSVEEYQRWVRDLIEHEHNALLGDKLAEERRHLHALPAVALPAYTAMTVKVRRWSTIRVLNHTYSVPARLISERVRVLVHHDHLEVYFAGKLVERLPRIRRQRPARIDYHHVIWSLAKKPGAFARYLWREELFPSLVFRRAYDVLRSFHGERADAEYVRILYIYSRDQRRSGGGAIPARAAGRRRSIRCGSCPAHGQTRTAECTLGLDRSTGSECV